MSKGTLSPLKLFLVSTAASVVMLVIACALWTDFKILEIANVMFWIGALIAVIGSGFFISVYNKYHGQSVAIMTTLKHYVPDDEHSIKLKEKQKSRRIANGLAVAAPGILMIIISWVIFAELSDQ